MTSQSTTILFFLMTSPQRCASALMKAAISAGLLPMGSTLAARDLVCTSGALVTSTAAVAVAEANAGDVVGGAASANQPVATSPGKPASAVVGTAGSTGERRVSAIAKIFTLPSRNGGPPAAIFPKKTSTWPPIMSLSTSVSPR